MLPKKIVYWYLQVEENRNKEEDLKQYYQKRLCIVTCKLNNIDGKTYGEIKKWCNSQNNCKPFYTLHISRKKQKRNRIQPHLAWMKKLEFTGHS